MSWNDERVDLLKKLWGEGRTAAEIAKELGGVTRNAVIGKAHRLKLSNRVSPIQQNIAKPVTKMAVVKEKPEIVLARPANIDQPPTRKSGGIKMVDLRDRMCRWPFGDPRDADFHFCGCENVPGLPYCPTHAKAAYQAASRNRMVQQDEFDGRAAPAILLDDDSKEAVG